MSFDIPRWIARTAVAAVAAALAATGLYSAPAANAAFVSTNDAIAPGYHTLVVDLTQEDVQALRSADFGVQDAKATWLCNNQVLPKAGFLPLDTKNACGSVLTYCATRPMAANELPTAYFVGNGTTGCGKYTVMTIDEAIWWIQKIFGSTQGSGTP